MRTSWTTRAGVALLGTWIALAAVAPIAQAHDDHGGSSALTVITLPPKDIAATTVTLRGAAIAPIAGASVTFQYGPTTAYGTSSPAQTTTLIDDAERIAVPITGLAPATTYHVRAVALSGSVAVYGKDLTFMTEPPDAPAAPAGGGSDAATPPLPPPAEPATDGDAAAPAPATEAATAPSLGQTVAVAPVTGTITVQTPAGDPVGLTDARTLPTGTIIDATHGRVALTSAVDRRGTTQTGRFWGGVFEVRQRAGDRGMTQLILRGGSFARCRATAAAVRFAFAARKRKPIRSLWGSDHHGRFQIHGRGSVATVRGTKWLTQDWCQGTATRVTSGAVAVRDLHRGVTVLVRRGHHYLARIGGRS